MTDRDKLIEAMTAAMYGAASDREAATAALKALRDTLEPVGHRYTNIADGSVTFTPNKWNVNGNYFLETPLFALPEEKPHD